MAQVTLSRPALSLIAATRAALADGSARRRRESAGIRVGEIAAVLGVTPQAVSQWEFGKRRPGAEHTLAYAKALAAAECPSHPPLTSTH